jgi:hypothetical protein
MDEATKVKVTEAIQQARAAGKSDKEIRDFMAKAGYGADEISQIFDFPGSQAASPGSLEGAFSTGQAAPQPARGTSSLLGESIPVFTPSPQASAPAPAAEAPGITQSVPRTKGGCGFCIKCGKPLTKDSTFCPACGYRKDSCSPNTQGLSRQLIMTQKKNKSKKIILAAIVSITILLAVLSGYYLLGQAISPDDSYKVYGGIYDQSNRALSDVSVSLGHAITTSDSSGNFWIGVPPSRSVMTFEKNGYVPIHKIVPGNLSGDVYYKVFLPELEPAEIISQKSSGRAKTRDVELSFGKESFTAKLGNETPEHVSISLTYFDPTEERDLDSFPGEFQGIINGEVKDIESFGFAKVVVQDQWGKDLDLAEGKTAKLKMRIPGDGASAPDEMPLWYFDEQLGYWTYKTIAKKTGSSYSGYYYEGEIDTVASWWNCDRVFERSWFELIMDSLFNEDFTNSKWRLLWDFAGILYEPIDWAHNIWTLLNPHTSTTEKVIAAIAFLPFITQSMLKGPLNYLDEVLTTKPTLLRLFERLGDAGAAIEKSSGGRVFGGKAFLQPTWRSGVFEAHLLPSTNHRKYIKAMNELIGTFDNAAGVKVVGRTASDGAGAFFNKVARRLGKDVSTSTFKPTLANRMSYGLGELVGAYPARGQFTEYVINIGASSRITFSSVAGRLRYQINKIIAGQVYTYSVLGKTLYHWGHELHEDVAESPSGGAIVSEINPSGVFDYTYFTEEGGQSYYAELIDLSQYADFTMETEDTEYYFEFGLLKRATEHGSVTEYEHDSNGYVTKEISKDSIVEYSYSQNYASISRTIRDKGGAVIEQGVLEIEGNKAKISSPVTGEFMEITYDGDMNVERLVMVGEIETLDYNLKPYSPKVTVTPRGSDYDDMKITYYEGHNYLTRTVIVSKGDVEYKLVSKEVYRNDGEVESVEKDYYEDYGSGFQQMYKEKIELTYDGDSKRFQDGSLIPRRISTYYKYFETGNESRFELDMSLLPDGYPELPPNEVIGNDYAKIMTDENGDITQVYLSRDALEALGIENPPEAIMLNYDNNGIPESIILSDGSRFVLSFDVNGDVIAVDVQQTAGVEDGISPFLSNFGLEKTLFTARIDGDDYNFKQEKLFNPARDTRVKLMGRGNSSSYISIKLGDATIFRTHKTSTQFGETQAVNVGPIPLAGARVAINLDSKYQQAVSGFLSYESNDGQLISNMPIVINPGSTQTFNMPIPAENWGIMRFRTFDFITSGVSIAPVPRLTMADVNLDVPIDCSLERTIMIAFDNSGSMSSASDADSDITKKDLQTRVLKDLLAGFGGNTKFALMALDSCPYIAVLDEVKKEIVWERTCIDDIDGLMGKRFLFTSNDRDIIFNALDGRIGGGGSNIDHPIFFSLELLKKSISPTKRIIALTDGEASFDFKRYNESVVPNIEISTVGIFSRGKSDESSELKLLRNVAEIGGGEFYHVFNYKQFYSAIETSAKAC